MRRLQDNWMDQTGDMQDATHKDIMKKAKAKYDLLVNSGKWGAKSPDQEKIIALEAQPKDLQNLKLSPQLINKLKQGQGQGGQHSRIEHKVIATPHQNMVQATVKIRRTGQTSAFNSRTRSGSKRLPRTMNQSKNKWAPKHSTGVFTTCKPEDCDIGKRNASKQANNKANQGNRQQTTANQATYTQLLAQPALQSMDE